MSVAPYKHSFLNDLWWRLAANASYVAARFSNLPPRHPRVCNICGYEGTFGPAGRGTRIDAKCPRCKSAERYRLFKLWLARNETAVKGRDILHFAHEKSMTALIQPLAKTYRTGDITPGKAELALNIEKIDFPDASFDVVVCSHVLEHVNDALALAEIKRVLRPGGLAIIMIPVIEGWPVTYENPDVTSKADRTLHYSQWDHIRWYGADVRTRIRAAGFTLEEFDATGAEVVKYGLLRGEKVFLAHKS